ncbi:glycosyltransferase [Acerihabitans arboris]|uniref:Glycosyltransferase n=1 Tax=Acerihabitans arboris TaxID=2691583 RepID=A0A845SEN7_9GAMM|nr:glycosyltransferase [Acerihabitans arboris]NDL62329.1 glycosyltransferase [Acerihabitans arboris]
MKVLHAAETIKGGVATVLKQLMMSQIDSKKFTSVISLIPNSQVEDLPGIDKQHIELFKRTGRNISSFCRLFILFSKNVIQNKPDIVHLHSTFAGVVCRVALIILWPVRRPKVIYCPHAFSFLMEGTSLKKKIYVLVEKFFLIITDKVICVSQYEKDEAYKLGVKSKKLVVIYNGVPIRESVRHKQVNDTFNFLFVGRLDHQKGYDLLIEAMANIKNPNIKLTIIGESVHSEIKKVNLEGITYTGWLKSSELEKYFVEADALVIPSRWEGFAMVPLEAMSYHLPIIASNSTSLPEVVIDGVTGYLFKNGNADDLREKMLKMEGSDLDSMSLAGNTFFKEHFTSEKMVSNTLSIYTIILESKMN